MKKLKLITSISLITVSFNLVIAQSLKEAIKLDGKDEELYFMLGVLYDASGDLEKSIDSMRKVVDINPRHANALNYIGYTLAEKGINLDEAENYIKNALALEPESGHIIDSLGWVYYKKGEVEKAITELERAITYLPDDAIVNEHLGDAYLKKNHKKKALDAYEKAGRLAPESAPLKEKLEKLREELKTQ